MIDQDELKPIRVAAHAADPGAPEGGIGTPLPRKDGLLKVTGTAIYSGDVDLPDLAYGYLVSATVAGGRVRSIDTAAARVHPGVIAVVTHEEDPIRLRQPETYEGPFDLGGPGAFLAHVPMQDDRIYYDGQYVALVVAETFEAAQEAASLIAVEYEQGPVAMWGYGEGETQKLDGLYYGLGHALHRRGDPEAAYDAAPVKLQATYHTPPHSHQPIELHTATARWQGDRLELWDGGWPHGVQIGVAQMLSIPRETVRVHSEFIGGSFGGKVLALPHAALCAAASKRLRRPVRIQLTRPQLFHAVGMRSPTKTDCRLGATEDGRVTSMILDGVNATCLFQDWACEPSTLASRHMYANPHMHADMRVKRANLPSNVPMRSPGEMASMFVSESLLNELAEATGIDPVEIRRRNEPQVNLENDKPWSSRSLLACLDRGAEMFGWADRDPAPGSMTRNGKLIGWGMASATYPTLVTNASVDARIDADGRITVRAAAMDVGTGTYTILPQIAADALGVPVSRVHALIGDTAFRPAAAAAGAMTAATVGAGVQAAAVKLRDRLVTLSLESPNGVFAGAVVDDVEVGDGVLRHAPTGRTVAYEEVLGDIPYVQVTGHAAPGAQTADYSMYAFGANYVEVEVDPVTLWSRVTRVAGAYASGTVLNPLTARSQILGGIAFAVGAATTEASYADPRDGRWATDDFGAYHVPVQADLPLDVQVEFVPEEDSIVNSLGVKGLGELGGVGMPAAITHALHHATGRGFVRHLPVHPESLAAVSADGEH